MSAESAVIAMLLANTALGALVSDDDIYPGQLDQDRGYPALVVNHISTVGEVLKANPVTNEALLTRVQVTCFADSYPAVKQLMAAVRNCCGNRSGTFAGVDVKYCRVSLEGPDIPPGDDGIYMQTQDLMVTWVRALP